MYNLNAAYKNEYHVYMRNAIGKTNFIADGLFAGLCLSVHGGEGPNVSERMRGWVGRDWRDWLVGFGTNNAVQRSQSVCEQTSPLPSFVLMSSFAFIYLLQNLPQFKTVKLIVKYLQV